MRNFTPNHRMTGVGNALKRHYQVFLLEYEQVGAAGCGEWYIARFPLPLLRRGHRSAFVCVVCAPSMPACPAYSLLHCAESCGFHSLCAATFPPARCAGAPRRYHRRPVRHLRARRRARQRLDLLRRLRRLGALLVRPAHVTRCAAASGARGGGFVSYWSSGIRCRSSAAVDNYTACCFACIAALSSSRLLTSLPKRGLPRPAFHPLCSRHLQGLCQGQGPHIPLPPLHGGARGKWSGLGNV